MPDSKPALTIRRATRDDVPTIVRMLADDFLGRARELVADETPASYLEAFDAIDASEHQQLVVAELDGETVGTLQLTFIPYMSHGGGWQAIIEAVRIASSLRGTGLGHSLIEWAIERARERGCLRIQLTSDKRRLDAHRFYADLGFEATHEGMKLELHD